MTDQGDELFAAVDSLLAAVDGGTVLPTLAERVRLREAAGLTQAAIAQAIGARVPSIQAWEAGRAEPRGERLEAYRRLLEGLAQRYPAPATHPQAPTAQPEPPAAQPVPAAGGASAAVSPWPANAARSTVRTPKPAPRRPAKATKPATDPRFPHGPLGVLDGDGTVHCPGGVMLDCPATTLPSLVEWTLAESGIGAERLHRHGRDADPLLVLTAAATERLGLPDRLPDRKGLRLDEDHPAVKEITAAGWQLTRRGFGPWARIYRPAEGARRQCVQLAVLPWDALDTRAWGEVATWPAAEVARVLGTYATRVLTPRGSTAVTGLELMTALRPPTRPARNEATGGWTSGPVAGSLLNAVDPAPPEAPRQCVQLAVLPWDALDTRAWGEVATWPAAEVARVLGTYATRVLTPRGSTAVTGLELMTALRPPTRPARNEATGGWTSGPVAGSLLNAVDPAPPEAPPEHPVAAGRDEDQVLDEEAYEWTRDAELLTDAECTLPYVIGLDVNMAFAAAANRLPVGLGEPVHTDGPRFDKKIPGCWYTDLSHIELDARLPSPFTPHGGRPAGPAWYATPTLAYADELGYEIRPLEAWLRPQAGPYLDPWYERLRDAYLATMTDLGVTKDLIGPEFLTAMETAKATDPGTAAVLSAIKATVKGGVGKLRERPQGSGYRPGERWPALERPTWRPDIRAAVIAQARTNMHRKMRTLAAAGLFPLAVLSDCVVYPAAGPSPLDVLPQDTATGKPLPGTFRLGVNPGMVKHEGTMQLWRCVEYIETGANPARHIKDDAEAQHG
ncbi:telomere-associated protein Tap [Streptomyces oceani]|uniref:Transcriptional regulator n=1 Tax=Streptomyces oceani TaxID=1075402 RepID=A0A1E7KQQ1_9ACTN|nr:helix-turn-helix domain-containing protein [Streptomyces oceani]OEV06279.1 transcriptional regulator [Streptomyces oceani]